MAHWKLNEFIGNVLKNSKNNKPVVDNQPVDKFDQYICGMDIQYKLIYIHRD